ncbi:hypothetical protein COU91_01640 [Candidatus Saccharibacteria bacterium CG10_big_fil_rev_8_21_14_0_10_47_8]|nr:MAG: hypothetical protein COU91_01640 [Candidatus Saccharibacteria bacterium CG10_big_fil_rev_8_21_14_0_10_47_8]
MKKPMSRLTPALSSKLLANSYGPVQLLITGSIIGSDWRGYMAQKALGKVTHYYDHLSVAVIKLSKGAALKKGDKVQFKGNNTDFTQTVVSLQLDHKDVDSVKADDDFGLRVDQKVHEGNQVYSAVK